ncbi:hypothetical protein ACLOJK_032973 [Asimina triloba]
MELWHVVLDLILEKIFGADEWQRYRVTNIRERSHGIVTGKLQAFLRRSCSFLILLPGTVQLPNAFIARANT